jgi:hypothetical protein
MIISITKDGMPRMDGRYPLRVGCIGEIVLLKKGYSMLFSYLKDADGNDKEGTLQTSIVEDIQHEARTIWVKTLNSLYTFAVCE